MKKGFVVAALCFLAATACNAQYFLAGSVGLNANAPKGGNSTTSFALSPTFGYSINDKFALGISLSLSSSSQVSSGGDVTNTTTGWKIEPFARWYFLKIDRLSFYAQGGIYAGGTSVQNGNSSSNVGLEVFPAIEYSLTKRFGLFAQLNYFGLGYQHTDSNDSFRLNFDTGNVVNASSFGIGFFFKF